MSCGQDIVGTGHRLAESSRAALPTGGSVSVGEFFHLLLALFVGVDWPQPLRRLLFATDFLNKSPGFYIQQKNTQQLLTGVPSLGPVAKFATLVGICADVQKSCTFLSVRRHIIYEGAVGIIVESIPV